MKATSEKELLEKLQDWVLPNKIILILPPIQMMPVDKLSRKRKET